MRSFVVIQTQLQEEYIQTNGITLHVMKAGDPKNPMILMLHGFPEFWYGWKEQIDFFVTAGYYLVIPDQRGYNLSDKPRGVKKYKIDIIADDIIGLLVHEKHDNATLISHDWGGQVAWYLATMFPDKFRRFIILNSPHPRVFRNFINHDPEQRKRSNYMFKMQWPFLPEIRMKMKNYALMKKGMVKFSNPGTFSDEDMEKYVESWRQKRALTGSINWYRAVRHFSMERKDVEVPTLIIWGSKDAFLKKELAQASAEKCTNAKVEYIDEATHWILHEVPQIVNPMMLDFIKN